MVHRCAKCKTFLTLSETNWFGKFAFCSKCIESDDFECHKKYFPYGYDGTENPSTIMPQILEQNITTYKNKDIIIKEYIPLTDVVRELKTITEATNVDKPNPYSYTHEKQSICVNPLTKRFYLKSYTHEGMAFPRPGDHSYINEHIVREIKKSELSGDILKKASEIKPVFSSYTKYIEDFPSFAPNNLQRDSVYENSKDLEYALPDKLYCSDFDFDNGAEYCYLRKVNDEYRLFYLKRFNRKVFPLKKECSEEFINNVFERIDSINDNPLDSRAHKGDFSLFRNSMPVLACDRRLTENECRAISLALGDRKISSEKHSIRGFFVLYHEDGFKLVKLDSENVTKSFYSALITIAKYGL